MSVRATLIRIAGRTHGLVYRLTGGRVLGRVANMPVLLLSTTGRHSGKRRTTPLTFLEDGCDLVVIASNGGEPRPPQWWLNLQADSHAAVTLGRAERRVLAREATQAEHDALWPRIVATNPGYARYARRTSRRIAVVLLTPDAGPP